MALPDNDSARRRSLPSTNAQDKAQAREVSVRRIARLFTPYRGSLTFVTAIIVAASIVGLASPFLLRAVIDDALPSQNVSLLSWLVVGMVTAAGVTAGLGVIQTWVSTKVGQQVMHRLRIDVFAHLQRQSLDFFTRTRTGEIQSRITNDIGGMETVVTSTAASIASNLTTVVATVIAMVALSWRLTLISLIVMPPAILLTRRVAQLRRRITAQQQRQLADISATVEESLSISGIQLSKTLGAGPALVDKFTALSAKLIDLELRSELAGRWRMASMSILFAAIPAVIYLSAGLPATSGSMTIGTLVAFTTLQTTLFRPLMGLLNVQVSLTSSLALFARIFEYLDLPVDIAEPSRPHPLAPTGVRGDVELHDVTFVYPGSATPALDSVSLSVPAGSTLAVVGETGSGKTTLAGLLARLYDPTEGQVTIDSVDIRDLALSDLVEIVGVVTQETYLLHASVRDNLRYARPDATDSRIEEAARAAAIHETIAALPDGYDTIVGSRGYRFSGGEKQRIAIARTLLRNPAVLVLDEATSALDNQTERAVQAAFDSLAVGRTTITIAHRLSTIRDADQIVVLDKGRVVESGTHDELLDRVGYYARLSNGSQPEPGSSPAPLSMVRNEARLARPA
ncbi:MAG: ABC transporter ATP-binding protein [Nocardioidaceae bacterium]